MLKTPSRREADQQQEVISLDCPPAPPRRDATVHMSSRTLSFPTLHSPSATSTSSLTSIDTNLSCKSRSSTKELEGFLLPGFLLPPRKRHLNEVNECSYKTPMRKSIDAHLGDLDSTVDLGSLAGDDASLASTGSIAEDSTIDLGTIGDESDLSSLASKSSLGSTPCFPILPSHDANCALQQGGPSKRIKLKPRRSSLLE